MNSESISDEAAKDIHAEAHPECEGCRSTLCLWQSGCACCPAPAVVVEGLPLCSQACADEADRLGGLTVAEYLMETGRGLGGAR